MMHLGKVADVDILLGTNRDESFYIELRRNATREELIFFWVRQGYTADEIKELKDIYLQRTYPDVEG